MFGQEIKKENAQDEEADQQRVPVTPFLKQGRPFVIHIFIFYFYFFCTEGTQARRITTQQAYGSGRGLQELCTTKDSAEHDSHDLAKSQV